jgi:hypothetical protein
MIESVTVFIERLLLKRSWEIAFGLIALIAPLYFIKTLWSIWFGPMEIFVGYKAEKITWLVMVVVDAVGFLSTLPAREKGRIMQVVMFLWTVDLFFVLLATLVR